MRQLFPLTELLTKENSRRNTDRIAELILQKPELFGELFSLYARNEEPLSRRAAWVTDTVSGKEPGLLEPYLHEIIELLPEFKHSGLKRMSLRMLSRYTIREEYAGKLLSLCFQYLISSGEPVAVKVFAMEIIYRFSQTEPGLRRELADSIEWRMDEETPGFRSHGKKILKKLAKELRDLHSYEE